MTSEAVERIQRNENGSDPMGYTASSWKVIRHPPDRLKDESERFIILFVPFSPPEHGSIGHQDPPKSDYRVLELARESHQLGNHQTFPDEGVKLRDPETQTQYVICHGDQFINQNPVFDADDELNDDDFNIGTLNEQSVFLGRKIDEESGYEPVGIDVVTYIRNKQTRRSL